MKRREGKIENKSSYYIECLFCVGHCALHVLTHFTCLNTETAQCLWIDTITSLTMEGTEAESDQITFPRIWTQKEPNCPKQYHTVSSQSWGRIKTWLDWPMLSDSDLETELHRQEKKGRDLCSNIPILWSFSTFLNI